MLNDFTQKLGGAAEHLIDSGKDHICQLSFEFYSLHAIERCSNDPCVIQSVEPVIQSLMNHKNLAILTGWLY